MRFVGQFGSDSHLPMLERTLDDCGVERALCRVADGCATGAAFILRLRDGHNSIVLLGGANHFWPQGNPISAEAAEAVRSAALVLLQREVPDRVNEAVAAALQQRQQGEQQRRILLDVGGSTAPLSASLLSSVLFLVPNETELAGLTGRPTESEEDMRKAAEEAQRSLAVPFLLVTMGERGSFLFIASAAEAAPTVVHCPAFPVSVVDSTGAGDTFRGAFAVAYTALREAERASPASLYDCMRFAAAAAALSCTRKGTIPSVPSRAQVDSFIAQRDREHPHQNPYR